MELLIIENKKKNTYKLFVKVYNPFNSYPCYDVLTYSNISKEEFDSIIERLNKDELGNETIYKHTFQGTDIVEHTIKPKYILNI